jgi:beta-glucanase (GH16 family)
VILRDGRQAELVWSDEFSGLTLDSSRWSCEIWDPGVVNNEDQYYTSRTNNVRLENGLLVLEARKETYDGLADAWTSARIHTAGKFEFQYGRVEFRAKIPSGQGPWPAAWLLGANVYNVGWPACGEIDVMEWGNFYHPTQISQTTHSPSRFGASALQTNTTVANLFDQFHLYVLEWSEGRVDFFIDGVYTGGWSTQEAGFPFDHSFFLILNLAMGGDFVGGTIDPALTSARYEVDYVRVYQVPSINSTLQNGDFEGAWSGALPTGWTVLGLSPESKLLNQGFEDGLSSGTLVSRWQKWAANSVDTNLSSVIATGTVYTNSSTAKFTARTGSNSLKLWGPNSVFQEIPVNPGESYKFSAWGLNPSRGSSSLSGSANALIFAQFFDNNWNQLRYTNANLSKASKQRGYWQQLTLSNVQAPAGAVRMQVGASFSGSGGSAYFDDFTLSRLEASTISNSPSAVTGSNSINLNLYSGQPITLKQVVSATNGKQVRLQFQTKNSSSSNAWTMQVSFLSTNKQSLGELTNLLTSSLDWSNRVVETTLPAGAAYLGVAFTGSGSGQLWLDSVSLTSSNSIVDSLDLASMPVQIPTVGRITFQLQVSSGLEQDLVVNLQRTNPYTWYGSTRIRIAAGTDRSNVISQLVMSAPLPAGGGAEWATILTPVGLDYANRTCEAYRALEVVPAYDFWASAAGVSPSINADPDGDGVNNLLEYGLLGSPVSADATQIMPATSLTNGYLLLKYRKRTNDPAVTVQAEESGDLLNSSAWNREGQTNGPVVIQRIPLTDGEEVQVQSANPTATTNRSFLRVRVQK